MEVFNLNANAKYATYVSTWAGGSPSIGNGSITAYFVQIGEIVHLSMKILPGSTTNLGSGGVTYTFTLPVTAHANAIDQGSGYYLDSGTAYGIMTASINTTTTFQLHSPNILTPWRKSTPFTWADGDQIFASLTYRAA